MMLYIHLPFCKQKCRYCAFCSGVHSYETMRRYVDRLIALIGHHLQDKTLRTIYIGGGTPGVLPLDLWEKLLGVLLPYTDTVEEFTVELNPESTTSQLLRQLKAGGVNRLSFGVQSLSDRELSAVGRLHTADKALSALKLAKVHGFDNISADLIYALPEQTPKSFSNSVSTLLDAGITHLSCYNLQLEEGTELFERQDEFSFPDEEQQMEMYDTLLRLTKQAGFVHYEISNFCRPDKRALHNSGYWTREDYLGLGISAHSKLGEKRCSFAEDISEFIDKKDFSFDEVEQLSESDIREEQIMLGLRTDSGVPLGLVDKSKAEHFVSMGLGTIQGDRFVLNDRGFMLSNTIIAELI
ncbi:MAG: radical SAM family heme chaperone HemW [Clostridia bacterium]|nr:radical SAM family heme chaperone HemW [Clostridia bacterium]